ncbi:MAG: flavodoxin domain-containing protein [Gemmobacter sp.]
MRFVLIYATTEGQTRKIMRACADRLAAQGHSTELIAAGDAGDLDLSRADGAILGGSLHAGIYQKDLRAFASARAADLARLPTLFVAVSLVAAGTDADDWKGLEDSVATFVRETGWTPGRILHVAGAFRFSAYDFFRSMAMRWIASQKGLTIPRGTDLELTDWAALDAALDDWAGSVRAAVR